MKQKYAKIIDGRVNTVSFEVNTLSEGYIEVDSNVFADMVLQDDGSYDYTDEFKAEHQLTETYADRRRKEYPSFQEFAEAYTEKEILADTTKWDEYVVKYNKVRTDNPK